MKEDFAISSSLPFGTVSFLMKVVDHSLTFIGDLRGSDF